jgi:hypothetical protein
VKDYPLARLFVVRERKAERARADLARERRLLAEALLVSEETERTAREFAEARPLEAQKLFEGIRGLIVNRQVLDQYHEAIAALAAREMKLSDLAEQARQRARAAEEAVNKAVALYNEAAREVDKFKEHRAIWRKGEKKRLEGIEELEAEEAAGITALRRKQQANTEPRTRSQ